MRSHRVLVAVLAAVLVVAGCGRSGDSGSEVSEGGATSADIASSSTFGDLSDVCQSGSPTGSPAQGVTDSEIQVGVMSDVGFTKVTEFPDAAKVFTSWCNDLGGINGRKLVATTRDSNLLQVRQRMLEACREDLALVGGGTAFDGLGVKERLNCTLPSFPAQVAQPQSVGADLEVSASPSALPGYSSYGGYSQWLVKDAYPDSANAVGIIVGDGPVLKVAAQMYTETMESVGATVIYNDVYPAMGISDWTPYAQSIKSKGVKGLMFGGQPEQLAKLEAVLTGMDYKLDWINTNNNAYTASFVEQLGRSAEYQNNFLDLGGVAPLESSDQVPAMKQLHELYEKYAPDAAMTLPSVRAFSAWLLFAKAAAACGNDVSRACIYGNAIKETAWTAGGLQSPVNLAPGAPPSPCFNIEQTTPDGWQPADFKPDEGMYRCNIPPYQYKNDYGTPMTLADVGKTMSDVS